MANKVFNHAGNDLFLDANWVGGVKPAGTDDVVIPKGSQPSLICSGSLAAINLNSLLIDEACDSVICSSGSPFIISTIRAHFRGKGNLFWQNGATSSPGQNVIVDMGVPSTGFIPTVEISGATMTNLLLQCLRGNITIPTSGTIPRVLVSYRSNPTGDVVLTANSGAGTFTDFEQRAGRSVLNNTLTTSRMTGGVMVKDVATITNNYVFGNAQQAFNTSGATCALMEIGDSAIVDLLQTQTGGVKTFTTTWLMQQAQLKYIPASVYHVFTNAIRDLR